MHWGTFELNREPFREPPDRLMAEALRHGLEEMRKPIQIALIEFQETCQHGLQQGQRCDCF